MSHKSAIYRDRKGEDKVGKVEDKSQVEWSKGDQNYKEGACG